jgi:tripartite-type tricarboxylate transporter receptor subunit TctC
MKKLILLLLALGLSLLTACSPSGETTTSTADDGADWPRKPIKIIVPFAPGGSSDQLVRVMQKAITDNDLLDQRLTVINVSGHYSVGCRKALSEKPDGYTFLAVHKGMMGGQATGIIDFGHNEFEPVAETSSFSQVITVREDSPWKTLDDLLEAAKEKPDSIIFGCNLGALNHMAGIIIQELKPGAAFRYVQIGGGSANFAAMSGRHIEATVFSTSEFISFRSKGLRALAYTGDERDPAIGDVPTLKELGHDRTFAIGSWWFAPKGTPQAAVDGLADVLEKAMQTDYTKEQLKSRAITPTFLRGADFQAKLDSAWTQVQDIAVKMKAQTKE